MLIYVGFLDHAFLEGVLECNEAYAALQIGAVQYGIRRRVLRIRLGLVLSLGVVVVDGIAVGEDN